MKRIFVFLFLIISCFVTNAQTKIIWTCPMHPQIRKNSPGNCPICGMTLVKKTIKVSRPKITPKNQSTDKSEINEPVKTNDKDARKDTTEKMSGDEKMNMSGQPSASDSTEKEGQDLIQSKVYILPAKTVRYDLYVTDTMVNFTGKHKMAIAINGSIPGPTLVFTEGDTAEIYLHNLLKEQTSLHWHGVILPNEADGVPFLTTKPINPGDTHLYKFKVVQNGTYWYHSHSGLQEQSGMYGALLFRKREEANQETASGDTMMSMRQQNKIYDKEYTVVLSEWTDEMPMQVQRRLRTGNDWYSIKKGSTQSYAEAIKAAHFKTKLINEWKRMKAMDVSDVFYDRFLLNGQPVFNAPEFKTGDKIKLKVVNAGSSSYFWLGYAGGKITIIGNDGNDVVPVEVDRMIIAPAETYDLIVTVPEDMSYEFRATSEDRTGYSSLWLGKGHKMSAPTLPRLKYFEGMKMMNDMMNTNGTMKNMGMNMSNQTMDMNSVMYPELGADETDSAMQMDSSKHDNGNMSGMNMSSGNIVTLNYNMLRSPVKTILPNEHVRTLHFFLTGNMNRYIWTIDNKTITESDRILIKKGEVLKLILTNNSMMRHPMHLHGHDFRLLNSQLEYSPLKNVIDIMPMETDSIEFAANQSGNWFFHCHILFHMMAGMGRVFTYENSPVNPELPNAEEAYQKFRHHKDQNMKHLMIRAGIETNGSDGEAMLSSNRYGLQGLWHMGYTPQHGYEGELNFGRYLGVNQWWYPYIGLDYHYKKEEGDKTRFADYKNMFGQISNKNDRKTFTVGVQYTMPWLVLADARVDGNGKFRFQLSREGIPVTARLRFAFMGNTDKEYMVGLQYIVSKWFAVSSHYDSDMGLGAGITITY